MNKINLDFIREKNDFKWNLIVLIYNILLLVIPTTIICLKICENNSKYLNQYKKIITEKNLEISRLEGRIRDLQKNNHNNNVNNLLTLNDNDTERKELKETSESKAITIKNNRITSLLV